MKEKVLILCLALSCLALTPYERKVIQGVKGKIHAAQIQLDESTQHSQWADQELQNAWTWGETLDKELATVKQDIQISHDNEVKAVAENQKMKPVYDKVHKYWGIGGIIFGFQRLAKHLFIVSIVLVVVGIVLVVLFPTVILPFFKMIASFFGWVFRRIAGLFKK